MVSASIHKNNFILGDSFLKFLISFSIIDCVFQISLGGFVRVTGSGLGCPDWPLCYGKIIPPMNYHTLIEWGHRTSGALLGLLILLINIIVWYQNRNNKFLTYTSLISLILVIVVGGIGGAVVLTELEPSLRTLHLFLAQMIIFCLGLSYVSINTHNLSLKNQIIFDKYSLMAGVVALTVLVSLLTGSYAVWKGAGTVCSSWPFCTSSSIIPESFLGWVHMTHRIASSLAGIIGLFFLYIFLKKRFSSTVFVLSIFSLAMIFSQIILGALNPWTKFDVWIRVAHLGASSLLWGSVALLFCLISFKIFRSN
ncbi:MAG: COX15/CtaA family protein [Dehalococcoidia bacterium]|nr:COX15/CtaA family protein [Chloroflexota bacterium]|tara:strand:- start:657 stop:1586 length:930 start_codon:yes stop_codon:yes gene_type:complete